MPAAASAATTPAGSPSLSPAPGPHEIPELENKEAVSHVIRVCCDWIDELGLDQVGVWRLVGASGAIDELDRVLQDGVSKPPENTPTGVVTGVVLRWLKDLPDGLFDDTQAAEMVMAKKDASAIHSVLESMELQRYRDFEYLVVHWRRVVSRAEVNNMSAQALASCVFTALVHPRLCTDQTRMLRLIEPVKCIISEMRDVIPRAASNKPSDIATPDQAEAYKLPQQAVIPEDVVLPWENQDLMGPEITLDSPTSTSSLSRSRSPIPGSPATLAATPRSARSRSGKRSESTPRSAAERKKRAALEMQALGEMGSPANRSNSAPRRNSSSVWGVHRPQSAFSWSAEDPSSGREISSARQNHGVRQTPGQGEGVVLDGEGDDGGLAALLETGDDIYDMVAKLEGDDTVMSLTELRVAQGSDREAFFDRSDLFLEDTIHNRTEWRDALIKGVSSLTLNMKLTLKLNLKLNLNGSTHARFQRKRS